MCHNSGIESEQQIERCMSYGMPEKAVKSVKHTIRKREKKNHQQSKQKQQQQQQCNNNAQCSSASSASSSSSSSSSASSSDNDEEQKTLPPVTVENNGSSSSSRSNNKNSNSNGVEQKVHLLASETKEIVLTLQSATTQIETTSKSTLDNSNSSNNNNNKSSSSSSILKIPKMCGRFRKLSEEQLKELQEQQPMQSTSSSSSSSSSPLQEQQQQQPQQQQRKLSSMEPSMDDALAVGTQMTRKLGERIYRLAAQLQASRLYIILTRTTQPAHLIAIFILSFVLLTVGPDLIENESMQNVRDATTSHSSDASNGGGGSGGGCAGSALATLAYLGAFATHFGAQIWMTFVSGLSLYFSLPRHTFGQCQQILFPKYFALNAMLSITMLIIYVKYFLSNWTTAGSIQLGTLALTAVIEVIVRLYLAPPMLRLMNEKYKIEDAIGSGQEVGSLVQGDLVQCPHYQRIHKAFRRIHMTIAIGNMIVLLATCLQLYFLASKIHIS